MMGSIEEEALGECIVGDQDKSVDPLISPESSDVNDIFGDPQLLPRVGDQYQVDIPPLVTESDFDQLLKNPTDDAFTAHISNSFLIGLPIPLMWIHDNSDGSKNELLNCLETSNNARKTSGLVKSEHSKGSNLNLENGDLKIKFEPLDFAADNGRDLVESDIRSENDAGLILSKKEKSEPETYKEQLYCPVPGSSSNSWSDFEQESFLLGLYIYGKNLVKLKRFIGNKEMGDILSFYYGKFYRSNGQRRWSECRKTKSRKCIYGQRIFTGWRQQELLSRLLPRVSEECQNVLLEVSRRFGDGRVSLEEYVSTLKANVGMELLIEVVGIGKGKQDLTGIVMEPPKASQILHTRLEIPVGKACASLTYREIIKFLTGDFRISKARANDLFWEAVWPRLTEHGWNSEQPKNHGYARPEHSYVFLIPGIKKFSRRKLVKGNHYFDSVSDVLNKVASEPTLIQLKGDENSGSQDSEEHECGTKVELDKDDHSGQRHFLQPRVSITKSDLQFTVVDTTSVHEEGPGRVRKLRNLPVDTIKGPDPRISGKNYGSELKKLADKLDSTGILSNDQINTVFGPSKCTSDRVVCSDLSGYTVTSVSKQGISTDGFEPTNAQMDCPKDDSSSTSDKKSDEIMNCQYSHTNGPEHANAPVESKQTGTNGMPDRNRSKIIKCQFTRRRKRGQTNSLAPFTKRRRLTACSHDDATRSSNTFCSVPAVKEKELDLHLGSHNKSDGMYLEAGPSHSKVYISFSAEGSPHNSIEDVLGESSDKTASPEKGLPRTLFDLNLPFSPDSEASEKSTMKMDNRQDYHNIYGSSVPSDIIHQPEESHELNTSSQVATAEQQTVARRHSTRNRPLTTKALEALECGFLTTKRKWRDTEPMPEENPIPKPSRQGRVKVSSTKLYGDLISSPVESKEEQGLEEGCSSDSNVRWTTVTGRIS